MMDALLLVFALALMLVVGARMGWSACQWSARIDRQIADARRPEDGVA